jgi:hypothetical protein
MESRRILARWPGAMGCSATAPDLLVVQQVAGFPEHVAG